MSDDIELPGFGQFLTNEGDDGTGHTDADKLVRIRDAVAEYRSGDIFSDEAFIRICAIVDSPSATPVEPRGEFAGQSDGTPPSNPRGPADEPCPTCDWYVTGCDHCCGSRSHTVWYGQRPRCVLPSQHGGKYHRATVRDFGGTVAPVVWQNERP